MNKEEIKENAFQDGMSAVFEGRKAPKPGIWLEGKDWQYYLDNFKEGYKEAISEMIGAAVDAGI